MKKKRRKLKKDRKKSWQIFQTHHLEYPCCDKPEIGEFDKCINCKNPFNPEITERITRTEHFFVSRIESYFKAHGYTAGIKNTMNYYFKKYKRYKAEEK